jgi:hypothetical protein
MMMRPAMLASALLAVAVSSGVRGQDTGEAKLPKKENGPKAGGAVQPADDGFGVGTKLTGTLVRSWAGSDGKRVTEGGEAELEVTKRSGKDFTAEARWGTGKYAFEVEGTIAGGAVKFQTTKSRTDKTAEVVGLQTFTGRFEKGALKGMMSRRDNPSFRALWELKTRKEP